MAIKKKTPSKLCVRCNQIKPLESFAPNKLWASQQYRDAWCEECAKKHCVDEATVKEYCYFNNRAFKENAWEAAKKKAQYSLANNKVWLNPMSTPEQKKKEEDLAAARSFLSLRNVNYAYEYVENLRVGNQSEDLVVHELTDENEKPYYDKVWQGYFTKEQVEWINNRIVRVPRKRFVKQPIELLGTLKAIGATTWR